MPLMCNSWQKEVTVRGLRSLCSLYNSTDENNYPLSNKVKIFKCYIKKEKELVKVGRKPASFILQHD